MKLLIATKNVGKLTEISELLAGLPVEACNLNAFPTVVEPEETGATFIENAVLKAHYYASQTGLWALADDSGLAVEALNGAPGVLSARYAGAEAGARQRLEKLLEALGDTENRRARFVCAMAVADESGDIKFTAEGFCSGIIAPQAGGKNGFGYDPIFIPDGFSATFGELPHEIKQRISHRKRAIGKIIQQIRRFYDVRT